MLTFTPGLWLYILSGIILLILAGIIWRFRKTDTGTAFLLLIGGAFIWSVGFAFETAAASLQLKILLANIQYIGLTIIPLAWLYLALSFRGKTRPVKFWLLLGIAPLITNLIIWSDSYHHLFRGAPHLDVSSAPFSVLVNDYQFWFYFIHVPTGYIYMAAAIYETLRGLRGMKPLYRSQSLTVLAALLLPVTTDVLYIFGFSPIPFYNITPAIFSVSAALAAWGLFRFQLLNIRPMAYELVFNNLQDGVIVLDQQKRIVDFNPAAQDFANLNEDMIGKLPEFQSSTLMTVIHEAFNHGQTHFETLSAERQKRYLDVQISRIKSPAGQELGHTVTLRDINERAKLFHQIQRTATFDDLTEAMTRRHFYDVCKHQIQRLEKSDVPFSILMFDLDDFKQVNDKYGHNTGDKALRAVSKKVRSLLRPSDFLGRIGGDEFAVLLSGADSINAIKTAERLRVGIQKTKIFYKNERILLTSSFGLITVQQQMHRSTGFDTLLNLADQAMYRAKHLGGNRIEAEE